MSKAKPLALPNVTQETIAQQAYRLFGAMHAVDLATQQLTNVRRMVAEAGVDPAILADLMKEAKADPWERVERDRTLAQYISILKPPGLSVASEDLFSDAEEPPPETDEEREEREYREGFWSFLTWSEFKAGASDAWVRGWETASAMVGAPE